MARYLVVEDGEVPILHEAEADNIKRLIDKLAPALGDKVTVYRIAGGPKQVTIHLDTVQRIEIT